MATPTNKQLREFILDCFNDSEFDLFCFDYFERVEQHFSDGMPLMKKVIQLISYCNRHHLMENLLVALAQERVQKYQITFAAQPQPGITREYNNVLWGIRWLPPTPIQIYHYAIRQVRLTSD